MPTITVRITNLAQIRSAFGRYPALSVKYLDQAIKRSVLTIEREGKQRTPVKTGRLRGSYTSAFGQLRGEVGPTAFYAIYVHEGTRYMKGRPFLLQGVKAGEPEIQKFFTDAVQKVLDDVARAT